MNSSLDKLHIRFDSDSEEEPLVETPIAIVAPSTSVPPSPANGNHQVTAAMDTSFTVTADPVSKLDEPPVKMKRTVDLLFEMKQHKMPGEKRLKTAQQKFGKKRAQHRKRALDFILMADYVDQAFGLDKDELKQVIASNGHQTSSSSTPQVSDEHISSTIGSDTLLLGVANLVQQTSSTTARGRSPGNE